MILLEFIQLFYWIIFKLWLISAKIEYQCQCHLINIDFLTNTSFSFINMIDCLINQYFDSHHWIYMRLLFIFISYIHIFQMYLLLLFLLLILKRESYKYLLVSIGAFKVYQANILGFFNQLLLLAIPIRFSGYWWIQGQKALFYNTDLHSMLTQHLIYPLKFIIAIVLPTIFYQQIKQSKKLTDSFAYFKYLYREPAAYQDVIQMLFKYIMLSLIYFLQRQQNTLLIILAITLYIQLLYLQANQPYFLRKLNIQCLQIYLWLYIQVMINGLIKSNHISGLNYLLTFIFYFIFIYLVAKCCINLLHQLGKDHYYLVDRLRQYINKVLGTHIKLENDRQTQIQHYQKEQDQAQNEYMFALKTEFDRQSTRLRQNYEREANDLKDKYHLKMHKLRHEMENARKKKDFRISQLTKEHIKKYNEIKNYYQDITATNLDMIKSLKNEINDHKKKEEADKKLLQQIERKHKEYSESLKATKEEIKLLLEEKLEQENVIKQKEQLKIKIEQAEIKFRDLEYEYEVKLQHFQYLEKEKDSLADKFNQAIQSIQQKTGLQNLILEKKNTNIQDEVEIKDLQLNQILLADNINPQDLNAITNSYQEVDVNKSTILAELRWQVAQIRKAHAHMVKAYDGKLAEFVIPVGDLGFDPLIPVLNE